MVIHVETDILFHEEQKSNQWWMWTGIAAWEAGVAWRIANALRHRNLATNATAETATIVLGAALAAAAPVLLATAKLTTEVRKDGLFIRYRPFHRSFRRVPLEDVTSVKTVTYNPLLEYGGWGIRHSLRGKAFNPTGNQGVRIEYTDGAHILIGSQKPEELAAAIESIRASEGVLARAA